MHSTMANIFISALYLIALFAWTGTASPLDKFCWSIDQQHSPPPCEPSLVHLVDTTFGSLSIRPPSRLERRGEILVTSYQNQTVSYNEPNGTAVVANEPNGFVVAYPLDLFLNQSFPNNSIEIQAAAKPIVLGHDLDVCTPVPWGRSQLFPVKYDAHPTTATFLRSGGIAFADSVPHSNILRVNRTSSSKGSVNLAAGLDDSELCNFNVTSAQNNTNAKLNSWGWTYGIIEDPLEDGCLYVSHYYVVGRLSPDGNYSYYFGDNEKPGTWNDTFNSVTLPRWSATTNNPTQLAIDSTTRKMYVAESGMHTIREIDMQSGLATIVAGNLSWSDFPPINCSYPSNCTADQLQLIYPSSVAVYVSAAFGETWLFVGDFTAALIYRIVLTGNIRTNAVTIISGKLFQYWDKSSTPARHSIAAYFDTTTNTGALFLVGQKGIQRIDWAEPPLQPLPSPTAAPTSTVDETAAGATAATVIVTALMGGVAVTESTTLLTVGSVRCRSSSSRKRSIMQQIFYFLASNGDENTPSTGAAWGMFVIVIIFSSLHVGAAALVYYRLDEEEKAKRGAWSTVCASGRCPSFSWIAADTLFPLSLYSAMEAVTTASQTSGEIVSGFILLAFITATFIVTRVYLAKHITPALQFVERVENPLESASSGFGAVNREGDTIGRGGELDGDAREMMPPRQTSAGSFASLTSSFASLLGIPSQHRNQANQQQQQALHESFTAYASGAAAAAAAAVAGGSSREEMQPDSPLKDDLEIEQHYSMPRWVRVVVPLGYWAPEDDTKRWGAGFSKMGEFHRDDKWCETILPMLSGIFSGAASGLYDRPACQPIMGVLGAMFLLAAVAIVWVQPYRMAPEHYVFMPVSLLLLSVICIANAIGDTFPNDGISVVQLLQCVLAVAKAIIYFIVMLYDMPTKEKHLDDKQHTKKLATMYRSNTDEALDVDPLAQMSPSPTTDDGSVGWSRQQTSALINDSFIMGLKHTGRSTSNVGSPTTNSTELFADPSALAAGRASRVTVSPSIPTSLPPPAARPAVPRIESATDVNNTNTSSGGVVVTGGMVRVTSVERAESVSLSSSSSEPEL